MGIAEIGFAEHVDFDPADQGFGFFDYDRYSDDIARARRFFKGKLAIRKGVEIDYQQRFEPEIKEWLNGKRFDFVIGSVHYVNRNFIDGNFVATSSPERIYSAYFSEVINSIWSGLFDVLGHLDIVRKYTISCDRSIDRGLRDPTNEKAIKAVLKETMEREMYLEVNAKLSVLRDGCRDTMPSKDIVEEYIESGGRLLSVGSDAHSSEELGRGIEGILRFLANYDENQVRLLFG